MEHQVLFGPVNKREAGPKLVWLTDLHLDATDSDRHRKFFEAVASYTPDIILVGGDISNGSRSLVHLKHLATLIQKPLYFVLGNHDYYYGSIPKVRALARLASQSLDRVTYLTGMGVVVLTPDVALIGHDGWSDGRAGDFMNSTVMLNDYLFIDELKGISRSQRLAKLNQLGTAAAKQVRKGLLNAIKTFSHIILLIHTPPFREACLYEGHMCDGNWGPHFVCQAVGDAIKEVMGRYPKTQLLVLCGHSHHGADVQILPNVRVLTGHSELGAPQVQGTVNL